MMRGQTTSHVFMSTGPGTWLIALLALAYFLANSGYSFLAFLAVILGFLLFVGGLFGGSPFGAPSAPRASVSGVGGGEGPIIVNMGGPQLGGGLPPTIQFQPNWGGRSSGEESIGKRLGNMANFFGGTAGMLFGSGKPGDIMK